MADISEIADNASRTPEAAKGAAAMANNQAYELPTGLYALYQPAEAVAYTVQKVLRIPEVLGNTVRSRYEKIMETLTPFIQAIKNRGAPEMANKYA